MDSRQNHKKIRKRLYSCLGSPAGQETLEALELQFDVHLPAFQGTAGHYDPLDAMRRDAYREVFLYIRHQLRLAREELEEEQGDHAEGLLVNKSLKI